MRELLDKIEEFNKAFKVEVSNDFQAPDLLRYKLMLEENLEYIQSQDDVEVVDAIGDMLYILCGTIVHHGLQDRIVDIFNEIHRSNMSKLGPGGPIIREDGKVLKGPDYSPPDIKKFICTDDKI